MIQSHLIKKLPLEDYLYIADSLKSLKLPEESEIVASQIYSYLEVENDMNKAFELSEKIISLNVNKPAYFVKHLELATKIGNKSVVKEIAFKLIEHNAVQFGKLVFDAIKEEIPNFDIEHYLKLQTILIQHIYRVPQDKNFILKSLNETLQI